MKEEWMTADEETLPEEGSEPRVFTEAEVSAARLAWETESRARIAALESALQAEKTARARRETEIRCAGYLRERELDEELSSLLLSPEENELSDEVLLHRVEALAGAVEAACAKELRRRTGGRRPAGGVPQPLSGEMIRQMPVSQLAELLR